MKMNFYYDTVSEAINDLARRGYTTDFEILKEAECLICNKTAEQLSPDEFEIDETYRFEGNTDPRDEMIVFAISSINNNLKGIVVNAYGMYSDSATSKIVERLINKVITTSPIKRIESLKPFSRDHHHSLLLCWKIRTGIKNQIEPIRIKKYAQWFWKTYLLQHFEIEEKQLFPILGNHNVLVQKAVSEHHRLKYLFESSDASIANLSSIESELNNHIRFEEREFYNEIQEIASEKQLRENEFNHADSKFIDNLSDPFWE